MTHTAPHDAPVLDRAALADLRALDDEDGSTFFAEVVDAFTRDFPYRSIQLHMALAASETDTAAAVTHAIKGSCAAVGAQRMALVCEQIEGRIRRADYAEAEVAAVRLTAEYLLVKQALAAEAAGADRGA